MEGGLWDNHFLSLPQRRGSTSLHKARVINTTQFLLQCEKGIPRNRLTFSYSEIVPQDKLWVPCFKLWVGKHGNPFSQRKHGWWNGNFPILSIFFFVLARSQVCVLFVCPCIHVCSCTHMLACMHIWGLEVNYEYCSSETIYLILWARVPHWDLKFDVLG